MKLAAMGFELVARNLGRASVVAARSAPMNTVEPREYTPRTPIVEHLWWSLDR